MRDYTRNFEFHIINNLNFEDRITEYFKSYDFKILSHDKSKFVFKKKWSILHGWEFNPLNWESVIEIELIEKHKMLVKYTVINNGYVTPVAFNSLYQSFILNLEQFLKNSIDFKLENRKHIKLAKKRAYKYHGILLIGILLGLFSGIILSKITVIKIFGMIGTIIGAIVTQKIMNHYLIKGKNIL